MTSVISGLGLAVKSLFTNQKALTKWIESTSTDDVRKDLTRLFLHGNEEENIGPSLTANELATLQERFKSVSLADTGLEECLSFYAGYPFQPLSLPLSNEGFLRAVIELTGRDARALDGKSTARRGGREKVFRQGRSREDKLKLLFAALAGGAPTQENILDVLSLVQPRPNMEHGPRGHDDLRPMAMRLAATADSSTAEGLTIPKEKLVAFMKAINLENPVLEADEISFDALRDIVDEPVFIDAVSRRVEAIFLNA